MTQVFQMLFLKRGHVLLRASQLRLAIAAAKSVAAAVCGVVAVLASASWSSAVLAASVASSEQAFVIAAASVNQSAGGPDIGPIKEAQLVRSVIEAQLAAFAKDDAAKAFSFAAPNIRSSLKSADKFMAMVRASYPVVYRPASTLFLPAQVDGMQALQKVQMSDAKGEAWIAVYTLEKQKNKAWRITGCLVVENKGSVV